MRSKRATGRFTMTDTLVNTHYILETLQYICNFRAFVSVNSCPRLPPVMLQVGSGMSVSGGGLPDVYHTIQLHFHWGGPATNGSEHTVDRRRYPMEVQYGQ